MWDRFAEINKWFSYFDNLSDDNAKYLYEKLEQLNNNVNNIIKEEIQWIKNYMTNSMS